MVLSSWVDTQGKKLTENIKKAEDFIGGFGKTIERQSTRLERNFRSQSARYDPFKLKEKHIKVGRKGIGGNDRTREHFNRFGGSEFNLLENTPLGISKFGVPWWQKGAESLSNINKRVRVSKPTWKIQKPKKLKSVTKNIKNLKVGKPIKKAAKRVKIVTAPKVKKSISVVKKNKKKIGTAAAVSGILSSTTMNNGSKAWIRKDDDDKWMNWI